MIEEHFKGVFERLKSLREYIANYSYTIPPYNLQNYNQQMDALNEAIIKGKELALPKQKFSFARK